MSRGTPENLESFNNMDPKKAKEIHSKGGYASGVAKRKRKAFKEELKILLELTDEKGESNNTKVSIALLQRALNGDTKAFEIIRDTIGEKPIEKQEIKEVKSEWFK